MAGAADISANVKSTAVCIDNKLFCTVGSVQGLFWVCCCSSNIANTIAFLFLGVSVYSWQVEAMLAGVGCLC